MLNAGDTELKMKHAGFQIADKENDRCLSPPRTRPSPDGAGTNPSLVPYIGRNNMHPWNAC